MAVIEFVQNYDDLSTDQGYQFKFYCNHCGNGYMSSFIPNKLGMAGGFLRAAGDLFGGVLGNASNSAYDIQRAVGGPAHDNALRQSVQEIKPLFTQCRRCGDWVCEKICWNNGKGLCKRCAPILEEELASAQATAAMEQVNVKAREVDQTGGINVATSISATCPQCGAPATGTKFCSECGASMVPKTRCSQCNSDIKAGAKFCPECGERV